MQLLLIERTNLEIIFRLGFFFHLKMQNLSENLMMLYVDCKGSTKIEKCENFISEIKHNYDDRIINLNPNFCGDDVLVTSCLAHST